MSYSIRFILGEGSCAVFRYHCSASWFVKVFDQLLYNEPSGFFTGFHRFSPVWNNIEIVNLEVVITFLNNLVADPIYKLILYLQASSV